jgi:hypothetical protein
MLKSQNVSRIQDLELQLEEALQMLRLVAANQRTCLEVEEWLRINSSQSAGDSSTLTSLMSLGKG